MTRTLLLVLLAVIAFIAFIPQSVNAANSLVIISSSKILIRADGTVSVRREIQAEQAAANILRGSNELAPRSLEAFFTEATDASNTKCESHNDSNVLRVQCQYAYKLAPAVDGTGMTITLPNDSLAAFLALLTVQYPQQVEWVEADSIQTPGVLLTAPPPLQRHIANASSLVRRVQIEKRNQVNVETRVQVSPGDGLDASFQRGEPRTLAYTEHYFPAPSSWLLWLLGAGLALGCVIALLPVRRLRRVEPSRFLLIATMVIGVFVSAIGGLLILFGLTWLWAADVLASFFARVQMLIGFLPSGDFQQVLVTLPFLTLVSGIVLTLLGGGLLRWQAWARVGMTIIALAGFFIAIAIAPHLILLPEWLPGQGLITLVFLEVGLLLTAVVVWILTRPEIRLRYAE